MIRRESISSDGVPIWILVPQIEHAHLAADVADSWQFDALPLDVHGDLRLAVRHHDDGWHAWDNQLSYDAATGIPVPFDAMHLPDSLAIWNVSIAQAGDRGPLVGYLVSGHFSRLLERFSRWRDDPKLELVGEQFLAAQRRHCAAWFDRWRAGDSQYRTPEIAELGVSFLQMFDAISLWFCCAQRAEPWTVSVPGGSWRFDSRGDHRWTIAPWPLGQSRLTLGIQGSQIPRGKYPSTSAMQAASAACSLSWTIEP